MATSATETGGKYAGGAIFLHWLIAVLVVFLFILGLQQETLRGPEKLYWVNIHTCTGLVYLTLVLVRIGWRFANPPPALPDDVGPLTKRLSGPVHFLIYALLVTIGCVGIVAYVWHGRVFNYGIFQIAFGLKSNTAIYDPAEHIHEWLGYLLIALACLHALAGLWHYFVRRDRVLQRMLPL